MSVDLLDSLPHGFLNFTLMSPEAREGAKLCLKRIRQALGMPATAATMSASGHATLTATPSTGSGAGVGGSVFSP